MDNKENGKEQPPAKPESKAPKTPYVISDEVKADFIEEVKKHFAENPDLEIKVPTIEEVVAAKYEPEVAEKMVAHLQFKADVLAELKEDAEHNAPAESERGVGANDPEVKEMVADGHLLGNAQRMVGERRAEEARQERVRSGKRFGFRVLTPLSYDGKEFAVGQIVSLTQAQADEMPWAVVLMQPGKKAS